jgi:hypothetical protein
VTMEMAMVRGLSACLEMFPNWHHWNHKTFAAPDCQLLATGVFKPLAVTQGKEWKERSIRKPHLEHVLDCAEENPGASKKQTIWQFMTTRAQSCIKSHEGHLEHVS